MKISIIIPVYNTRQYIQDCIESVLNQSVKDFEIIIVDDGSDDGSWEIIQKYNNKYDNITAFQQERKRQGAARNLALRHASGEFIAFLDSDDTVPPTAYEKMYEMAQSNMTDMVIGIQQSFSNVRRWVGVPVHQKHFRKVIGKTNINEFPELLSDISACNKLFRHAKLRETSILFPEQTSGEDLDFTARTFLKFDKISVLPEVVYDYRARPNASTARIKPSFFRDRVATTQKLSESYSKSSKRDVFQYLLRSELRKLVGNRFTKVVNNSPQTEQEQIIGYIQSITALICYEKLAGSQDITLLDKMKIILLKEGELKALFTLIENDKSSDFLGRIENSQCRTMVQTHWLEYKHECSNLLSQTNLKGYRQQFYRIKRGVRISIKETKKFFRKRYYRFIRTTEALSITRSAGLYCLLKFFLLYCIKTREKQLRGAWILDERWSRSAEDNSLHFFNYLRTQHPELPVYYIIRDDSFQKGEVEKYGNTVPFMSWQHLKLLHNAAVLISTDSFKALAYPFEVVPSLRRKTVNVFLQHGVSGNKTMTYYKKLHPNFNMVVTSNDREKRSFVDVYGFKENEVALTGLARFDKLPTKRSPSKIRKVLVAPTWRKWLADKQEITGSTYLKEWSGLLQSQRLVKVLENHNIQLIFQPHFNMMKFIGDFEGKTDNIQIITNPDELLQKYIIECDLLITDYSSVMYDFFYQLKPVYSMMFDRADWECPPNGPPLLDFEKDLPLHIFSNNEELLDYMEDHIDTEFNYDDSDLHKIKQLFKYRDQDNCKRIYDHILTISCNGS